MNMTKLLSCLIIILISGCATKQEIAESKSTQLAKDAAGKAVVYGNVWVTPQQPLNLHFSQNDTPTYNDGKLWSMMAGKAAPQNARTDQSSDTRLSPNMRVAALAPGRYKVFAYAGQYVEERKTEYAKLPFELEVPASGKAYYFGDVYINISAKNNPATLTGMFQDIVDFKNRFNVNASLQDFYAQSTQIYAATYGSRLPAPTEKSLLIPAR